MTRHRFTVEVDSPADAALVAGHIQFTLGRWTNLEQVRVIPIPPVDADQLMQESVDDLRRRLTADEAEIQGAFDDADDAELFRHGMGPSA